MVLLKILNAPGEPVVATHFPYRLGRASGNDLCLSHPGVWEHHAEIRLDPEKGFQVAVLGEGMVAVNGEPVSGTAPLRNGDQVRMGSLELLFGLSPAPSRGLRWREWAFWAGWMILCLAEVALVYWLPT